MTSRNQHIIRISSWWNRSSQFLIWMRLNDNSKQCKIAYVWFHPQPILTYLHISIFAHPHIFDLNTSPNDVGWDGKSLRNTSDVPLITNPHISDCQQVSPSNRWRKTIFNWLKSKSYLKVNTKLPKFPSIRFKCFHGFKTMIYHISVLSFTLKGIC